MNTNQNTQPHSTTTQSNPRSAGRPTVRSRELLQALCDLIAEFGFSDSAAAAAMGIDPSTISRWKREDETCRLSLAAAHVRHRIALLQEIRGALTKDGRPDWRAAAWLLERTYPEEFGRPSARRPQPALGAEAEMDDEDLDDDLDGDEEDDEEREMQYTPDGKIILTPKDLRQIQRAQMERMEQWRQEQAAGESAGGPNGAGLASAPRA